VSDAGAREPREHRRPARQSRPRNGQHQERQRNGQQPDRKANNNNHHQGRKQPAHQQQRREQPRAASDGSIASVSFLQSKPPRQRGHSGGGAHRAPR
jgi:hypothetical protein